MKLNTACLATETSLNLEISRAASVPFKLSKERIKEAHKLAVPVHMKLCDPHDGVIIGPRKNIGFELQQLDFLATRHI